MLSKKIIYSLKQFIFYKYKNLLIKLFVASLKYFIVNYLIFIKNHYTYKIIIIIIYINNFFIFEKEYK